MFSPTPNRSPANQRPGEDVPQTQQPDHGQISNRAQQEALEQANGRIKTQGGDVVTRNAVSAGHVAELGREQVGVVLSELSAAGLLKPDEVGPLQRRLQQEVTNAARGIDAELEKIGQETRGTDVGAATKGAGEETTRSLFGRSPEAKPERPGTDPSARMDLTASEPAPFITPLRDLGENLLNLIRQRGSTPQEPTPRESTPPGFKPQVGPATPNREHEEIALSA